MSPKERHADLMKQGFMHARAPVAKPRKGRKLSKKEREAEREAMLSTMFTPEEREEHARMRGE